MRAAVLAASVAFVILWAPGIARAGFTEHIDRYHVIIEIRKDDSLRITEVIDYDFGVTPHHGIFRDVPTRLRYDETDDRVYPFEVESVSASGGAPAAYEVENIEGGKTRIKIGDPDVTVSGGHRYTIVYTLGAAMNGFPDHDELYWNAIGAEWSVPIDQGTVEVRAPDRSARSFAFAGRMARRCPVTRRG